MRLLPPGASIALAAICLLAAGSSRAEPSFTNVSGAATLQDNVVGNLNASGPSWSIGVLAQSSLASSQTSIASTVHAPQPLSVVDNQIDFDLTQNARISLDVVLHDIDSPELYSVVWSLCGDASGCVLGQGTSLIPARRTLFDNGLPDIPFEDYQNHRGGDYEPDIDHTWPSGGFLGSIDGTWENEGLGDTAEYREDYQMTLLGELPADHYTLQLQAEGLTSNLEGNVEGTLSVTLAIAPGLPALSATGLLLLASLLGVLSWQLARPAPREARRA